MRDRQNHPLQQVAVDAAVRRRRRLLIRRRKHSPLHLAAPAVDAVVVTPHKRRSGKSSACARQLVVDVAVVAEVLVGQGPISSTPGHSSSP